MLPIHFSLMSADPSFCTRGGLYMYIVKVILMYIFNFLDNYEPKESIFTFVQCFDQVCSFIGRTDGRMDGCIQYLSSRARWVWVLCTTVLVIKLEGIKCIPTLVHGTHVPTDSAAHMNASAMNLTQR